MNEYRDIRASLLRLCSDFARENGDLAVVNLDGFTESADLPEGDFIGLTGLQMDLGNPLMGQVGFALSTANDTGQFRLADLVNALANRLMPASRIFIYNATTGRTVGQLSVLTGTRIAPPVDTERNPIQPVYITFQSA